jgi:SPP1 family predicted phage head-tail adaptor
MPDLIFKYKDPLVIEPSELWHFITIQRGSQAGDGTTFGKSIAPATWDDLYSTWAAIYTSGGREVATASRLVSQVTHVVKIRYNPAFTIRSSDRIVFGRRFFTVQFVENVKERNIVLLISCVEIDGGGQC